MLFSWLLPSFGKLMNFTTNEKDDGNIDFSAKKQN